MSITRDEELLAAYLRTRWTIRLPEREISIRIGEAADRRVPVPSAIVTAYNPGSTNGATRARARENAAAQAGLVRQLSAMAVASFPTLAHGTGPNAADWDEPGVLAIDIARPVAVSMAEAVGQNAIVWIDSDRIPVLVATRAGFAGASLGSTLPTRLSDDRP